MKEFPSIGKAMKNTSCMKIAIAGMVLAGTWLPKSLENTNWKLFYYAYAIIFQMTLFLPMIYVQTVHLFVVFGDIAKTVEVSFLLLTHFAQVAKTVTIWCRQDRIKNIFKKLESPIFNRDEPEKKAIVEKVVTTTFTASKILVSSTTITAFLWGVYPLLKPVLKLPLGYPDVETGTFLFIIIYAQQAGGILFCAIGDQTEDFLAGGLMALAAGQLDLLRYELLNIRTNKNIKDSETHTDDSNHDSKDIIACIKFHQEIINYVKELNAIFGTAVLCQFAMSCLIICMTALKITITTDATEIITVTFYLVCILAELVVYCYPGDIIKYKSQLLAEAAYCSNWVDTSPKTRSLLLLLTVRAQCPLTVTAGNVFELSLKTFTTILRSSYSYFAVLNQKNNS